MDRRLGEPQNRSGRGGEEKNSQPRRESNPRDFPLGADGENSAQQNPHVFTTQITSQMSMFNTHNSFTAQYTFSVLFSTVYESILHVFFSTIVLSAFPCATGVFLINTIEQSPS
jgi:hypothetical protein